MSRRGVWVWVAILGATFLAYLPALRVGWVFDDQWNIVDAPSVHWTELSGEKVKQLLTMTGNSRRVVSNLSFALNHMAGGLDPRGYHLVNVLIHLGVGLALAWLCVVYLQRDPDGQDRAVPRAAVAIPVTLFLLHPVNTQAVTYVVQRMTALAALFCILSFTAYLKGRQATPRARALRWYAASAGFWVLGLASKENAAVLPLVVLVWELCCGGHSLRGIADAWRRWSGTRRAAVTAIVVLVAAGVVGTGLRFAGSPTSWTEPFPERDFSAVERLITQTRVGILYASLILWPAPGRLNLDHDITVSHGLLDPATTLLAALFWIFAIAGAVALARRRPLWGFPILAYLACHTIEAGPLNLELAFEHRIYLPLAMLALLPAAVLIEVSAARMRLAMGSGLAVSALLGVGTFTRNALWADPIEFHRDIATKSPNKPRAQRFLAHALIAAGRADQAIDPARRAVELDSSDYQDHLQLGTAYKAAGYPDEALDAYHRAIAIDPLQFQAPFAAGIVLGEEGRTDEAIAHFTEHGIRQARAGLPIQAIPFLQEAVELAPESSAAHNQLGNVYGMANRLDDAVAEYRIAVELDDTNVEAVYNLAYALEFSGRMDEAIPHYRRFVEIAPPQLGGVVAEVRRKLEGAGAEG